VQNHVLQSHLNIVKMLEHILSEGRVVILGKVDGDYSGGCTGRRPSTSPTLEGCVELLTGNPRKKICIREDCPTAGVAKPLDCFTTDFDSRDGHSSVCKLCESGRVGRHARRRKIAAFLTGGAKQLPDIASATRMADREVDVLMRHKWFEFANGVYQLTQAGTRAASRGEPEEPTEEKG
jgi:hypothetical protein